MSKNSVFDEPASEGLARILTVICFRNGPVEDIHAGRSPVTKSGDYSDVRVVDADGNVFQWSEVSRITQEEMKVLNKTMVNRLYTFFRQGMDERFAEALWFGDQCSLAWDDPEIDPGLDCETREQRFLELEARLGSGLGVRSSI